MNFLHEIANWTIGLFMFYLLIAVIWIVWSFFRHHSSDPDAFYDDLKRAILLPTELVSHTISTALSLKSLSPIRLVYLFLAILVGLEGYNHRSWYAFFAAIAMIFLLVGLFDFKYPPFDDHS